MSRLAEFAKDWKNQSKYGRWLWRYTKPYIPYLIFNMLLSLLYSCITIGLAVLCQKIIDTATAGDNLTGIILIYIVIIVAWQIVSTLSTLVCTLVDERFSFGIRKQVYDKILNSLWIDISKYRNGDIITRMTSDTSRIADGIAGVVPAVITYVFQAVATFITLYIYSSELAMFTVIIAPVAVIIGWLLSRRLKNLEEKVMETESDYRSFMHESIGNLMVIKSFGDEKYASDELTRLRKDRFSWVFKKAKMNMAASVVMSGSFQLAYVVAFAWGAVGISNGTVTFGTMTVFLTLVNKVQEPVANLAASIPAIVSIFASAGRVMEIQNIPEEEKEEIPDMGKKIGIDIKNMTFSYNGDEKIFENANLKIAPGEFAAVVGTSGVGKTTLIRLLMSFLNVESGEIKFFNSEGMEVDAQAACRSFISYVPQGNTLLSGTIYENVIRGRRTATEEEVIEALKKADAWEFVKKLEEGMYTRVGEKGYGLSEGQAQRIAIARAIIKNAPVLILDEATSALDEKTELKVLEEIKSLSPGPTCIIVTHRTGILPYCEKKIEIYQKTIIEK